MSKKTKKTPAEALIKSVMDDLKDETGEPSIQNAEDFEQTSASDKQLSCQIPIVILSRPKIPVINPKKPQVLK